MKRLKIICISVLLLGLMAGPAIAQIGYSKDILEPGNPPGGTCDIIGGPCDTDLDCADGALKCINPTLKTWDETWDLTVGETMDMDIWVTDVAEPEGLLSGGFFITYDPALITVTGVVPNDTNTGGQFDGTATSNFAPAAGQWFLSLVQFSCVAPDGDGDVYMGRATFQSLADGQVDITISTIPDFSTVVGCGGTEYDTSIAPNTVIVNESVGGCDPPDCDDGISCTEDFCNVDICENTPNDALCDDGDVCNGEEVCDPASDCQSGEPLVCDDGDLCTTDSCDPATGCTFTPVACPEGQICDPADGQCVEIPCETDQECDDGIYCNGAEICDTGTGNCQAGIPPDCDDGVDCTADMCDTGLDTCVNTPDDGICDDGDLCTTDSCDPATGCTFTPVACPEGQICDPADGQCVEIPCETDQECDDGIYCNGAEICDTGTGNCQAGIPPDCDDGVDCTIDGCNEASDMCDNTPDDGICDDGLYCTGEEVCDPATGCESSGDPCPVDTICNEDTNDCDPIVICECGNGVQEDECDEECDGDDLGGVTCEDLGFAGGVLACSTECIFNTDGCTTRCTSNAECDNALYCDGEETCNLDTGECQAGTPPNCNDDVGCTDDICDEDLDACVNNPNDENCPDDGVYCNGAEYCDEINDCDSTGNPCDESERCDEENDECVLENQPPDCSEVIASMDKLWPPNHKYVDIHIIGVTDPDGDPITITIDAITQDEEVNAKGKGDGNTSPDGIGVGTDFASVRSERQGTGNGRIYEISFFAMDDKGGECTGFVQLCVPHDQRPEHVCIDDGQDYDSTVE